MPTDLNNPQPWVEVITAIGSAATALSLIVSFIVLWWTNWHTRKLARDQFTADLLREWGGIVGPHREAIEVVFPNLFDDESKTEDLEKNHPDVNWHPRPKKTLENEAFQIYRRSVPGSPEWKARFAIIELLNYLEFVTEICRTKKCDSALFWRSYGGPLQSWRKKLEPFANVVGECRGLAKEEFFIKGKKEERQIHSWSNFVHNLEQLAEVHGHSETTQVMSKQASA